MKRVITFLTIVAIIIMTVASLADLDVAFRLFIGESSLDQAGRLLVLLGLFVLAMTSRPRTMPLRVFLGILGVTILTGAIVETYTYQLALLDALVYLVGATSLLIEAIEPEAKQASSSRWTFA